MSQCIDTISGISGPDIQMAKEAYWRSTTLTQAFENWFTRKSQAFLRHREQIRVLSVFSCDPRVDVHIINTIKQSLSRFRYVVVEPVDSTKFEKALSPVRQSSLHSIDVSPYPHFLTYDTLERFDLILIFGIPLNRSAAEIVIRKSTNLLRPGGQSYIFEASDNELGDLIRLFYSIDDDNHDIKTNLSTVVSSPILTPLCKEDSDQIIQCDEEIMTSSDGINQPMEEEKEKPSPKQCKDTEEEIDFASSNSYPSNDTFLTYSVGELHNEIDIAECLSKTKLGIYILSGLTKIDLSGAMVPLINKILEFLIVKTTPPSTMLPYNFSVFTVFSEVMAEVVRRVPDTTSTKWFPQGEKGRFVNAGLERWCKNVQEWRSEGSEEPLKKMSLNSIDEVVEIISNQTILSKRLPEPIALDELLPLCSEVWKCEIND